MQVNLSLDEQTKTCLQTLAERMHCSSISEVVKRLAWDEYTKSTSVAMPPSPSVCPPSCNPFANPFANPWSAASRAANEFTGTQGSSVFNALSAMNVIDRLKAEMAEAFEHDTVYMQAEFESLFNEGKIDIEQMLTAMICVETPTERCHAKSILNLDIVVKSLILNDHKGEKIDFHEIMVRYGLGCWRFKSTLPSEPTIRIETLYQGSHEPDKRGISMSEKSGLLMSHPVGFAVVDGMRRIEYVWDENKHDFNVNERDGEIL